jgi:hypothetical protein
MGNQYISWQAKDYGAKRRFTRRDQKAGQASPSIVRARCRCGGRMVGAQGARRCERCERRPDEPGVTGV